MDPRQRVLFVQLQLAGLGVILLGFGLWKKILPIALLGVFCIAYALVRWIILSRIIHAEPADPELEEQFWKKTSIFHDEDDEEQKSEKD